MKITYPFFDYSLFENFHNKLNIRLNVPKFNNIIFKNTTPIEGMWTNYFNVIKNKNNDIIIFYRAVPDTNKGITDYKKEFTCLLESKDGINFSKNNYNHKYNVIYNKKNGISHNFFVLYNHNHLDKYLAIGGILGNDKIKKINFVDGIYLLESFDNIKWKKVSKIIDKDNSLKQQYGTYFDSLNCLIYHTFYKKYYIYARYNIIRNNRKCQMFIYNDNNFKVINNYVLTFDKIYQNIYAPNVMQYPNSVYFISTAIIQINKVYKTQRSLLLISQDGINWKTLSENWLKLKYQYYVTPHIIEIDNEFYIYVNNVKKQVLELWKIEKDRISGIENNTLNDKSLITKQFYLIDNNIILNFKTFATGYVILNFLDNEKNIILSSLKLSGNHINYNFNPNYYENNINYIEIILNNAIIYSLTLNIKNII